MDPRSDARLLLVERVAARVHLEFGAVVVVGCVHRSNDGHVVHAGGEVRQPVGDQGAGLSMLPVADLKRENFRESPLDGHNPPAAEGIKRGFQGIGMGCFREGLSRVGVECRLGIKCFQDRNTQMTLLALGGW